MEEKLLHIIEQVRKLYQRYGIKSVTMDDVANHLCISKKTLYEYFKDKEDLVKQVLLLDHERSGVYFRDILKAKYNAVEELLAVYKLLFSMYRDYNPSMEYDIRKYYPDLYNKIRQIRRKRMLESTSRNLNKGKKEGFYRKEMNTKIIARLHVLRVETLFDNDLFTIDEITSFKVFHEIFLYHLYGILNPAGMKFFEANFKKLEMAVM